VSRLIVTAITLYVLAFAAALPRAQTATDGQSIFRFETFGDEQLWTEVLQMQHVIDRVSPATALSVGLKVDADALPATVINALKAGELDLNDPAVTIQLLKRNS
jgi:hypothetical protein